MDRPSPVGFEALLAHASWVRQLATHLLRDPDQAEDLVQETWQRALERPPVHGTAESGLRAWLGRVMRNLAIDEGRDSVSRSWHEQNASRPEAWFPEEIAERVAIQRSLAESVLALEEPYRSVITLRYFEGHSLREIARRQDIAYDTAGQRISRGLAMLRARLDHEYGDNRAAWCLPLAALIRRTAPPHPPSSFVEGGLLAGVPAKLLGGIAAAVLVASLFFGQVVRRGSPEDPGAGPPVSAALGLPPAPDPQGPPPSSRGRSSIPGEGRPTAPAIDRDHELHGRVIGTSGNPIGGAVVDVVRDDLRGYPTDIGTLRERRTVARTKTDPRGEFAVSLPIGRPFELDVSADGFAPERLGYRYAGEQVAIQLGPGATLFGRATRSGDGSPIPGALLEVSTPRGMVGGERIVLQTGETDSDGRFRFANLPATSIVFKIAPSDDRARVRRIFDLVPGSEREENVVLDAGLSIRGRVLDAATKEPIAGAEVGEAVWSLRSVHADAGGEYLYPGMPKQGPVALQARAEGYGAQTHVFRSASNVDDLPDHLDFLLSPGRRVRGRVVDGEGGAIAGAYVAAVAYRRITSAIPETDRAEGRTTERGGFELSDLRGDLPHSLVVRKDGFGTVAYELPSSETEEAIVDLGDVVLPPMSVVRGSILDEAGQAVPDCEVALRGSNADRGRFRAERDARDADVDSRIAVRTARSDDLGRFAFADLAPGEYRLEVGPSNATTKTSQDVSVGRGTVVEGLRIALPSPGTIAGCVTDPRGNGLVQAGVFARGEGPGIDRQSAALTDSTGHFSLEGLPPGTYQVRVAAGDVGIADGSGERHAFLMKELKGVSSGEKGVKIVLEPAAVLRGRAVNADGAGVAGAAVLVRIPGRDDGISTFTGADGRFTASVPEGTTVDLEVHPPPADGTAHAGRLSAVAAGDQEVVVKMPRRAGE